MCRHCGKLSCQSCIITSIIYWDAILTTSCTWKNKHFFTTWSFIIVLIYSQPTTWYIYSVISLIQFNGTCSQVQYWIAASGLNSRRLLGQCMCLVSVQGCGKHAVKHICSSWRGAGPKQALALSLARLRKLLISRSCAGRVWVKVRGHGHPQR